MGIEKITYPVHDDFFKLDVWNNNIKAIAEQFRTDETRLTEVEKKAGTNATNIGTLSNLTTTEKTSLVKAVNEVGKKASDNTTRLTNVEKKASDNTTRLTNVEKKASDNTTRLTNVEKKASDNTTRLTNVEKKASDNTTNIGTLTDLKTTEKTSLVGAINEHNDELDIINACQDMNTLLEHANTFAISTSVNDVVSCNGRGGTLIAENHKIIIMKIHAKPHITSFMLIAKTKEELKYKSLDSNYDGLAYQQFTTTKGNTIYCAALGSAWVNHTDWNVNDDWNCKATIDGVENVFKYAIQANSYDKQLPISVLNLADFILYDFANDSRIKSGWYPQSDRYWESIGSLSSLSTKDKSSLVGAVNEVKKKASDNTTNIGTISNLTTTEKGSLVGAINEVRNKVVKISSANSTSISTISKSGYMVSGTIKYVKINGFCTVFFDEFYCLNASGSLGGATLVNSRLPSPVAGFKINDEIMVKYSGELIGGKDAAGSIIFTGTVTYPLYSAL